MIRVSELKLPVTGNQKALEKKLAKENNPKKKYKLILAALEKDPQLGLV